MTTHLDEVELVDALEGLLSASRDTHLEQCPSCTERLRSLRASIDGLRQSAGVPEPSPFFWEHFSRRVTDAVRAEETASQAAGWWRPARIAALSAAALVVVAATTMSAPLAAASPLAAGTTGSASCEDMRAQNSSSGARVRAKTRTSSS